MSDLNPETGKPVKLAPKGGYDRTSDPEPALPAVADAMPESAQEVAPDDLAPVRRLPVRFTKEELGLMNVATRLVDTAKTNLAMLWRPIQEKYGLPDGISYDRKTGEVKTEDEDG